MCLVARGSPNTLLAGIVQRYQQAKLDKNNFKKFNGKQTLEDAFLSAFQSESYQLLQDNSSSIMGVTEQSQDLFGSGKELKSGTDD